MSTELKMPKLGESVVEGTVSKWLKKEGDTIKEYDPLLEVSTDKVDTEVPSPADGVILKIMVPEGETVDVGTPLCIIGQSGETVEVSAPTNQQETPKEKTADKSNGASKPAPQKGATRKGTHITPVVARIAAEHNIDVTQLQGSGAGGRVTKKDILAYIESGAKPSPAPAEKARMPWDEPVSGDLFSPTEKIFEQAMASQKASKPQATPTVATPTPQPIQPQQIAPSAPTTTAPGEIIPFTGMRKSIADHMVMSKRVSPHVTTVMEADCSRIAYAVNKYQADFQQRVGLKLTFTPFFVSAIIEGLKAVPMVNSVLTERGIELKREINIGMAVALDDGLIVPVIKQADNYNLTGLQRAVTDLAIRARSKQLSPDDVQGGTFTISNHGVSGSLLATPIINQPQVGILGVGKIEKRVVVISQDGFDTFAIRPMCYLSFTFDHRILDGASADKFLATVKNAIETWQ